MLQLEHVHAEYGPVVALRDVSLTVGAGRIATLIGANGAGKSTLMMGICGSPPFRAGRVLLEGEDITRLSTDAIMRRGIAQVPEGRRIFPRMSVLENLRMGAYVAEPKHFAPDLEKMYTLFPRLKDRQAQMAGTLSGGEQQMVALARALMARPRLLLLDEPSLGLAPLVVKQIFETLRWLNAEEGMTIFLVEQNARAALKLAHDATVLANGAVALQGPAAELLHHPSVRAAYLEGHIAPQAASA